MALWVTKSMKRAGVWLRNGSYCRKVDQQGSTIWFAIAWEIKFHGDQFLCDGLKKPQGNFLFRLKYYFFYASTRFSCIITNLFRQKFSSCIIHNCLREVILGLACRPQMILHVRLREVKNRFCLRGEIDGTAVWCPLIRSARLREVSVSGGSTVYVFIFVNP